MVPKSLLNQLRRDLVARLDEAAAGPGHAVSRRLRRCRRSWSRSRPSGLARRRLIDEDPPPIELVGPVPADRADRGGARAGHLHDLRRLSGHQAVRGSRCSGAAPGASDGKIYLATPRIEKPGESSIFAHLARQGADGMLVRNAGGLRYCVDHAVPFVVDFSLNAANPLDGRAAHEPRRAAGDGILRPERRPAFRPARRDVRLTGSRSSSISRFRCFTWSTVSSVRFSRREPTRPTAGGRATTTT